MKWLREGTAATIKLGPFVDSTDGATAETVLTIQKADVRLSKEGGDMAAASADQGASDAGAPHDELGYYDVSLDTTDTGTLGRLKVAVSKFGAMPVWDEFLVIPQEVYDALVAGTTSLGEQLLTLDWTTVSATIPDFCALNAMRATRCRVEAPVGGPMEVYEEDGITVAWTATLGTDAEALPIIYVRPVTE
jgi:hypothetical protein